MVSDYRRLRCCMDLMKQMFEKSTKFIAINGTKLLFSILLAIPPNQLCRVPVLCCHICGTNVPFLLYSWLSWIKSFIYLLYSVFHDRIRALIFPLLVIGVKNQCSSKRACLNPGTSSIKPLPLRANSQWLVGRTCCCVCLEEHQRELLMQIIDQFINR